MTVRNAGRVIGRASSTVENFARGSCFEITAAAHLKDKMGATIVMCDKLVGGASVDFLDSAGTLYQCKAVETATYLTKVEDYKAWCNAALEATGDPGKVKWVVPDPDVIPQAFREWLDDAGIETIKIGIFHW